MSQRKHESLMKVGGMKNWNKKSSIFCHKKSRESHKTAQKPIQPLTTQAASLSQTTFQENPQHFSELPRKSSEKLITVNTSRLMFKLSSPFPLPSPTIALDIHAKTRNFPAFSSVLRLLQALPAVNQKLHQKLVCVFAEV
jgi:hypothetical protein